MTVRVVTVPARHASSFVTEGHVTCGHGFGYDDSGIVVNVPLKLKKRGGRKEVILPQAFASDSPMRPSHQEALVIAIARAHRWQKLLDEGKFKSVSDLAREIGLDPSFAARLLRLTLLAPDIVEAILMGEEPSGLSLTKLTKRLPLDWERQRKLLGFHRSAKGLSNR